MLFTQLAYAKLQWRLVSASPLGPLTSDMNGVRDLTLALGVLCLLVGLGGAGLLGRLITDPIHRLQRDMAAVEAGDLSIRFAVVSGDETGKLGAGFNSMLEKIGALLDTVAREQKQKREYELALLQEQIKPHFLYNTLDTALMLIDMRRLPEARRTIRSLSHFFRSVLSEGREVVTVAEELDMVRDYLAIQHQRFPDAFRYTVEAEDGSLQNAIAKLTLQPLVENAIHHGLKPADRPGLLAVSARRDGDGVSVVVADEGVGIPAARLQEILARAEERDGPHVGLKNVNDRIRLFFGPQYGLLIRSRPGEGTVVTIRLPLRPLEGRREC